MKTKKLTWCSSIGLTALTILLLLLGKNAIPAAGKSPVPKVPLAIDPAFATPEKPGAETASEASLELMFLGEENLVVTATKL